MSRGGERSLAEHSGLAVTLTREVVSASPSRHPQRTPGWVSVPVTLCRLQTALLHQAQRFMRRDVVCLKKRMCFHVSGHSRAPAWTEPVCSSDGDTDRGTSLGGGEPTPWPENPGPPAGNRETSLRASWLLRKNRGNLDWLRKGHL